VPDTQGKVSSFQTLEAEKGIMKIKISIASMLILLLAPCIVDASLVLTQGQSFEFEFNSIEETAPFSVDLAFAYAGFSLGINKLTDGESVIFSVYEDSTSQPAIRSETFDGISVITLGPQLEISGGMGGRGFLTSVALAPWHDLQGVFKVEVVSGTIELSSFHASTVIGGNYYKQTYAVPEPNSVALVFLGTGVLYLRRKRFSNQSPEGIAAAHPHFGCYEKKNENRY
jgi:hypothetical protein